MQNPLLIRHLLRFYTWLKLGAKETNQICPIDSTERFDIALSRGVYMEASQPST